MMMKMEALLTECCREDENALNLRDFEIYKSNICHLGTCKRVSEEKWKKYAC